MVNVKCKSGKDRTGAMLLSMMNCFDYWADGPSTEADDFPHDLSSTFQCDAQPFTNQIKILLGSGAWSTAVAQDCQCAALQSLGQPMSTKKEPSSSSDTLHNLLGVGSLSRQQRSVIGPEILRYHNDRSAYNGDFHAAVTKKYRSACRKIKAIFQACARRWPYKKPQNPSPSP